MRHAIVIGLPWLRSGTGQVMAGQIKYLKELGFFTVFAAVASHYDGGFDEAEWQYFRALSPELGAGEVITSGFNDLSPAQRGIEIFKALAARKNAMHWALAPANFTQPAPALLRILQDEDVQVILANHVYTLPFALRIKASLKQHGKTPPLIVCTHDVQSHILLDRNAKAPWKQAIEPEAALLQTELQWLCHADALIHVSGEDIDFFSKRLPHIHHHLMLPALGSMNLPETSKPSRDLLYVGGGHPGNVKSMSWYFEEVVPLLKEPKPRHTLVGEICDHRDEFLSGDQPDWLELAGRVDNLEPFYANARAVICPTISGRGISVKTIEAFAAGLHVIGMPLAFRGIPHQALEAASITPAASAEEFARAIERKTNTSAREKNLAVFRQYFSHGQSARKLTEILRSLQVAV
jgi:polysaccharide biosynthesis protein PslH